MVGTLDPVSQREVDPTLSGGDREVRVVPVQLEAPCYRLKETSVVERVFAPRCSLVEQQELQWDLRWAR